MSGNYSGRARTELDIADLSVLISTGLKGVSAVLGVTERGEVGKPVLVGSVNEYNKHFGGLLQTSDFPLYCRRVLEAGGKLLVSRVVSYNDPLSITGHASRGTALNRSIIFDANSVGIWGDNLNIKAKPSANGVEEQVDITVTLLGSPELDITVKNVAETLTLADINRFNSQSLLAKLSTDNEGLAFNKNYDDDIIEPYPAGGVNFNFAGGEEPDSITTADYIGDAVGGTGIHSFDNDSSFTKIAIPEIAIPEVDAALSAYADQRGDCIAVLRTPIGISGLTAVDYRNGTGIYSHTPINSWRTFMFYGSVQVSNPADGGTKSISVIADVLGAMSRRDNKDYEWFSFGGAKRGLISNVIGFDYNLASPARTAEFDQVDIMGLNAVVSDKDFGAVIWGNNSLSKNPTLLKHANIAELMIFLSRNLTPIVRIDLFDPNDIETWKAIHRKVRPFMQRLVDKRAMWAFLYQGDQNIDDISQAVINDTQGIDNGEYHFILWIKPKAAMKYIGIKVVVTNSGVNFEEVAGQPNL